MKFKQSKKLRLQKQASYYRRKIASEIGGYETTPVGEILFSRKGAKTKKDVRLLKNVAKSIAKNVQQFKASGFGSTIKNPQLRQKAVRLEIVKQSIIKFKNRKDVQEVFKSGKMEGFLAGQYNQGLDDIKRIWQSENDESGFDFREY